MQANLTNARLFTNPFSSPSIHIYRSVHTCTYRSAALTSKCWSKSKNFRNILFLKFFDHVYYKHKHNTWTGLNSWHNASYYCFILIKKILKCFVSRLKWLVKLFKKFTEKLLFFGFYIKNVDIYFDIQKDMPCRLSAKNCASDIIGGGGGGYYFDRAQNREFKRGGCSINWIYAL